MVYFALLRLVSNREGQIQSMFDDEWTFFNLAPYSAQNCSCIANCICCWFLITQFLAMKLCARIPLQIGDNPLALFLYLCVNFHKCVSVGFYD